MGRTFVRRLSIHFAPKQIFMDVDLDAGIDFVEAIAESVGSCDVLIAVVGKRWLVATDEDGSLRLNNPNDFVRTEVVTALKRGPSGNSCTGGWRINAPAPRAS